MLSTAFFIRTETGAQKEFIEFLLTEIEKLRTQRIKQYCFSFNVHDLEINFEKNEITISENLFEDSTDALKLTLEGFINDLLDLLNNIKI